MITADAVPTPKMVVAPVVQPPPKASQPKQNKVYEDLDRPVTPQELQEANELLKLGEDTAQRVRELRRGILEGTVNATEQRKKVLGLVPYSEVHVKTPPKGIKIKAKYSKEQFEKYLETAKQLDERRKKQIAEAISDAMKGAEQ